MYCTTSLLPGSGSDARIKASGLSAGISLGGVTSGGSKKRRAKEVSPPKRKRMLLASSAMRENGGIVTSATISAIRSAIGTISF